MWESHSNHDAGPIRYDIVRDSVGSVGSNHTGTLRVSFAETWTFLRGPFAILATAHGMCRSSRTAVKPTHTSSRRSRAQRQAEEQAQIQMDHESASAHPLKRPRTSVHCVGAALRSGWQIVANIYGLESDACFIEVDPHGKCGARSRHTRCSRVLISVCLSACAAAARAGSLLC